MREHQQLFHALHDTLRAGQDAAIVTVIESRGSAPRGPGAMLLVPACGQPTGTTGGGSAEYAAELAARQAILERRSFFREFSLHSNEAADLGMICGGEIKVYVQYFSAAQAGLAGELLAAASGQNDCWLVTRMQEGSPWECAVYTAENGLQGEVSLPAERIAPHCQEQPAWLEDAHCFIAPLSTGGRACIFGGGHISRALVPVLSRIGFRALVFEDRPEFADAAHFPDADGVLLCRFEDFSSQRKLLASDYAIIMTRGHQSDFEVLLQVLASPAGYIGMIGSRHKVAATKARVIEAGFTEADFARVHTPIGLAIGAQTPAEIAISIAAEMISHRAGI